MLKHLKTVPDEGQQTLYLGITSGWSADLPFQDWGRVARDPGMIRSRRFIACARGPLQVLV